MTHVEPGSIREPMAGLPDSVRAPGADGDATERRETATKYAEVAARASYGRLLAILAAHNRDIELAEDCLGDAFARALAAWPVTGVPANPEAWLLAVARNRGKDAFRSAAARVSVPLDQARDVAVPPLDDLDPDAIPDRRLALLFACGHPAIDPAIRTPLMLQTVLGLDARRIAAAFAIPPSAMTQRLVRAKRRIRTTRIPFVVPDRSRMPERLTAVLEAIYGAYAIDWQHVSETDVRESLASEAHYLAVTLAELLGDEPEAHGLAALISLSLSRLAARGSSHDFVPLEEQDTTLWDTRLIAQGERHLRRASAYGRIGRFQLEAAIQSVHCARAASGSTDWTALRKLHQALVSIAPTLGARVARAATIGRLDGAAAGLAALDEITDARLERFQPAWAARAHLLAEAGRVEEACRAFDKARSLTTDPATRLYLERRVTQLRAPLTPGPR